MVTASEQRGGGAQLDHAGRLAVAATNGSSGSAAPELTGWFRELLCADIAPLGSRVVRTVTGHLGVVTFTEGSGPECEFWAGAALRVDAAAALRDAVHDALLARWNGSVLAAGAARLIALGICRAAIVTDHHGTRSLGGSVDVSPLTTLAFDDSPGLRLAARNGTSEFRALSLGSASVKLNVVPTPAATARVDEWFDALEDALV